MLRKSMAYVSIFSMLLFAGCGNKVPNLTGTWEQTEADGFTQVAEITADTISVYWCEDDGETRILYWAGSFEPPTSSEVPYIWDSKNDTAKTNVSILASPDATKEFVYDGNELTYDVTFMGIATRVHMIQVKEGAGYGGK